jgi:hypothetical protein
MAIFGERRMENHVQSKESEIGQLAKLAGNAACDIYLRDI